MVRETSGADVFGLLIKTIRKNTFQNNSQINFCSKEQHQITTYTSVKPHDTTDAIIECLEA